jgi:hypothetical protein
MISVAGVAALGLQAPRIVMLDAAKRQMIVKRKESVSIKTVSI